MEKNSGISELDAFDLEKKEKDQHYLLVNTETLETVLCITAFCACLLGSSQQFVFILNNDHHQLTDA